MSSVRKREGNRGCLHVTGAGSGDDVVLLSRLVPSGRAADGVRAGTLLRTVVFARVAVVARAGLQCLGVRAVRDRYGGGAHVLTGRGVDDEHHDARYTIAVAR